VGASLRAVADKEVPMYKPLVAIAGLACVLATPLAGGQELDEERPRGEIQLSDDTIQLRYVDSGKNVDPGWGGRASGAFFLSEERDIVLNADVLFPAQIGYDRLELYFGPRAYAALLEDENNDVMAVSLGLEFRFEIDPESGFAVAGQAFYAPDILTFGTANNITDLSARLEIEVQPRLTVFAGMRWFEFDLTEDLGTRTLQEELFAGAGWRF
jgi:hypothetical protein